ncbi:transmembrane protein, putative [Medicago truncatula]|uniref:Transmembrane protein, putative n=1 Tax=Medicago truncatula TaxID=3880 RepID=A0A072UD82_MEDTR|nr:transmembrane protein, putative [Medicago truncatula]
MSYLAVYFFFLLSYTHMYYLFYRGRRVSSWWHILMSIIRGVGTGMSNWFDYNFVRVVDDGTTTYFRCDSWLEGGMLCHRFRGLFNLAENIRCQLLIYVLWVGVLGVELGCGDKVCLRGKRSRWRSVVSCRIKFLPG